jgi:hypothetical protein
VYRYDPSRKLNRSKKFANYWKGPCQRIRRTGKLDYKIRGTSGKESVVHINRLKLARNPEIWKPKVTRPCPSSRVREPSVGKEREEQATFPSRKILVPLPQGGNPDETPNTPNRESPDNLETPVREEETPEPLRNDQNYSPSRTPRSRLELRNTTDEPPTTTNRPPPQSSNRAHKDGNKAVEARTQNA